jgi:hypothetical protein
MPIRVVTKMPTFVRALNGANSRRGNSSGTANASLHRVQSNCVARLAPWTEASHAALSAVL